MKRPALLCLLALAIGGVTLDAHHSIAGIYDSTQKVTIDGTVVEFRFVNPHPYLVVNVTSRDQHARMFRTAGFPSGYERRHA